MNDKLHGVAREIWFNYSISLYQRCNTNLYKDGHFIKTIIKHIDPTL